MLGAHNDLTELKPAEAELEKTNALLESFVRLAAHDLREPARNVSAFSELLTRDHSAELSDEGIELLAFVRDGALRMGRLIDGLTELSQLNTQDRTRAQVDLGGVAADVVAGFRVRIDELGASVTLGPLPTVLGHPNQLLLLMRNLLGNALKFHAPGAAPAVEVTSDDLHALIVRDHGVGIPDTAGPVIFEMFRRYHRRSEFAGEGIGLALCARIAELHGGSIDYESKVGEGTTFRVRLPRA